MMKESKRNFWADPVRCALETRPDTKGMLALGAALMAVYAVLVLKLCAAMEGVAVIAAVSVLCAAILTVFAWRMLRGEETIVLLCAAALAMLAVGAHLAMLDIKPGRYGKLLEPMLSDMWNYGFVTAAAWEDDAWSGVYLLFCALLSRVENFSWLYAVKLFDLLCQCLAAAAAARIALARGAKKYGALAAMFACVLAPTMLMNAGLWAQCDATFAMLALWGLALLMEDRPMAGCVFWGVALATKLQSAFLFPLLIVLFMNNKVQLRHILALAAAAFLAQIAIVLDGQGVMNMITRYAVQLENARWGDVGLSDNMPGVYGLMNVASTREFSGMGLFLGVACALLVVAALLKAKKPLDNNMLGLAALLLCCGLPLILPQMNARSLYLAGMLAFAMAGNARRMLVAGVMEFISICTYMLSIFGHTVLPIIPLCLMAIGCASLVLLELVEAMGLGKCEEARRA